MNDALFEKLKALEAELRMMVGTAPNSSIVISFDANGTTYSITLNDGQGGSSSEQKRFPLVKTFPTV